MFNAQSPTRNIATAPGTPPSPSTATVDKIVGDINIPSPEDPSSPHPISPESSTPDATSQNISHHISQTQLESEDERILAMYDEDLVIESSRALVVYKPKPSGNPTRLLTQSESEGTEDDIILPDIIEIPRSPTLDATPVISSSPVVGEFSSLPLMITATPYGSPPTPAPASPSAETESPEFDEMYQELVGFLDHLPKERETEGNTKDDSIY